MIGLLRAEIPDVCTKIIDDFISGKIITKWPKAI